MARGLLFAEKASREKWGNTVLIIQDCTHFASGFKDYNEKRYHLIDLVCIIIEMLKVTEIGQVAKAYQKLSNFVNKCRKIVTILCWKEGGSCG